MNIEISAPNLMRTYVRYLIDVLHDQQQAGEVIYRLQQMFKRNVDRGKVINNMNEFSNEAQGLIAISGEDVNSSFFKLFLIIFSKIYRTL